MKRALLVLFVPLICLLGCQAPQKEQPTPPLVQADGHDHAAKAPQPALGKFSGEGTIKKVQIKVSIDFKDGGQIQWTQEKSGKPETWGGRWRQEGSDLLLLLTSPSGAVENAVFEAEGADWRLIRYGNDQISGPDRLLISKVQP